MIPLPSRAGIFFAPRPPAGLRRPAGVALPGSVVRPLAARVGRSRGRIIMLDKRCHYKVRELSKFYLFIKHKKIYYAYFPQQRITRSTGMTDVRNILDGLEKTDKITY